MSRSRLRRRPGDESWQSKFLAAFEKELTVTAACDKVGVGRSTAYDERQRNEEFAVAWHDVEVKITERLEREAMRRGFEGVEKPVYQGGEQVGTVLEFSDRMLEMLLKARAPEKYRERVDISGRIEHSDLAGMSDDELRRIAGGGR